MGKVDEVIAEWRREMDETGVGIRGANERALLNAIECALAEDRRAEKAGQKNSIPLAQRQIAES